MAKRLLGTALFAILLGAFFFAATLLFTGTASHAQKTSGGISGVAAPNAAPAGVWSTITPFPTVSVSPTPGSSPLRLKRAGAAAYPPNGKVYVMGGRHGTDGEDVALQWIWEYSPSADTWTRKNALLDGSQPGSRYTANMAVAVLTTTSPLVYAVGGSSINSDITGTVRIYDPGADTVNVTGADQWPANPPRIPGGYAVYNDKLYIFGGFSALGSGSIFTDTWVFDPNAARGSQWAQLPNANLSVGRGYIAGAQLDGYIYAIGGDTWDSTSRTLSPVNTVERLDPRAPSPSWTAMAALPTARGDMGAWAYDTGTGYEISGRIAIAGGVYPVPDNVGYLYNPQTNSWGSFPAMVHATRNYGAAELNGYLYAMGGYDYSGGIPSGANFSQKYDATQPIGTPTNTATGTPPTATNTPTRTYTPTITPTVCSSNYVYSTATATIVPGTTDTGNHCDDCGTTIGLPFAYSLYGQTYNSATVTSNGQLDFGAEDDNYSNSCLPDDATDHTIFPYWDDLRTDGAGEGVFTSVSGSAPNRIFNIEWRAEYFSGGGTANFEVRLYEGQQRFDLIYGPTGDSGAGATTGVQKDGTTFTQFQCNSGTLNNGLEIIFTQTSCGTPVSTSTVTVTPTAVQTNTPTVTVTPVLPSATPSATHTVIPQSPTTTSTSVPSSTSTSVSTGTATTLPSSTASAVASSTSTAVGSSTATQVASSTVVPSATSQPGSPTATFTPCTISFTDVHTTDYFYHDVTCVYCLGAVSGYSDGTFRPFANTTRGQTTKIIVLALKIPIATPTGTGSTFSDVPRGSTFFDYVETAAHNHIVNGYGDGTFRPNANVTRGQLSKIDAVAANQQLDWDLLNPSTPTFSDVPRTNPFFTYIETVACHGVVAGYSDGTFRWSNDAIRAQIAKIVCDTAQDPPALCTSGTPQVTVTP